MKQKFIIPLIVIFILIVFNNNGNCQDSSVYKYILDYNVPQSPGFTALGIAPEKIQTGSASKPIIVSILSNFFSSEKVEPGIAIDFSPYLLGIRLNSIKDYGKDNLARILINTLLSVATVQSMEDTNSLAYGIGFRSTLWDSHDPLQHPAIIDSIEKILNPEASNILKDSDQKKEVKGLKEKYKEVIEEVRKAGGNALSFGYGLSGLLKGGILSSDSIVVSNHNVWTSFVQYSDNFNFYATYQGRFSSNDNPKNILGIALRTNNLSVGLGGELIFNFQKENFEGGIAAEVGIITGLSSVLAINIENVTENNENLAKAKLTASLKWNIGN
ncbi:MAG: hypothetical protein KDC73_02460 [Ignavibacteriae bacterium]|nr:hypothetical protein [Ignavibacteriota bacterium]MCB9244417.1 hypothetical protein [Ignavibacteriales bacterium]